MNTFHPLYFNDVASILLVYRCRVCCCGCSYCMRGTGVLAQFSIKHSIHHKRRHWVPSTQQMTPTGCMLLKFDVPQRQLHGVLHLAGSSAQTWDFQPQMKSSVCRVPRAAQKRHTAQCADVGLFARLRSYLGALMRWNWCCIRYLLISYIIDTSLHSVGIARGGLPFWVVYSLTLEA